MNHLGKILFLLIGVILSCSPKISNNHETLVNSVSKPNPLDSKKQRINQLFEEWNHKDSPGASVAIVKNGEILFSNGYGMANLEYDIPNSSKTVFNIASVSKQFTAFSIALLADNNQLSLDDDIRKYLSELPDFGKKITISNLVHHTSGLKDFFELLMMSGWLLDDVISEKKIMETILNQRTLNFEPGEDYLYSNTGYILLAKIVEKVSGLTLSEWAHKNIFEPLKMKNTFFNDDYEGIVKNMAYSYREDKNTFKKEIHSATIVGAGGLFTTAEDLALWVLNFDTVEIGNKNIMSQIYQCGVLNNGKTTDYAFGQEVTHYKEIPFVVHGGGIAGYRTYLCRFPAQNLAIIVLSNLASFNPKKKAMQVADLYLKDSFPVITMQHLPNKEKNKHKDYIVLPISVLKEYVGRYEIADDLIFNIWLENDVLKGHISGKKDTHVFMPISEDEFELPTIPLSVKFERDNEDKVNKISLFKNKVVMAHAPKIAKFDAEKVNLTEYTGKYFSKELLTYYNLEVLNNHLIIKQKRGNDINLSLEEPDYFVGNIIPRIDVEVKILRNAKSEVSGLKISSKRAKNVWFEKSK